LPPYLVKYVFKKSSFSRTAWANCHGRLKLSSKVQPLKIVVEKNTCLTMGALCNSLTRRYLPSNSHNNWLYAAAATNKKDCNKILSHTINVQSVSGELMMSVGKTKPGLRQFDNYLSYVKINETTVNNSCFLPYSRCLASSWSFSRTVPRHAERVRQSAFLPVT